MILYSKQHKTISDISLSFSKLNKVYTKISEKILKRDLIFYDPQKYETHTMSNFTFITLWTVFSKSSSKISTLKIMKGYNNDNIKEIMKEKEKIVLFQNTLKNDLKIVETINKDELFKEYMKGNISLLYMYSLKYDPLTRLQKRKIDRIDFFLSYFPKIKEYLDLKFF